MLPRTQHGYLDENPRGKRTSDQEVAWTELWHTMLRAQPPVSRGEDEFLNPSRALVTRFCFACSMRFWCLQGVDRQELVKLTADFGLQPGQPNKIQDRLGRVITAEQFALSSMGATIKLLYDHTPPVAGAGAGPSLSAWRHEAVVGRDQYVKVAYEGYLYPWGHRASYIQITRRKIVPELVGSGDVSYLEKKYYIIVKQRTVTYSDTNPLAMFPEC